MCLYDCVLSSITILKKQKRVIGLCCACLTVNAERAVFRIGYCLMLSHVYLRVQCFLHGIHIFVLTATFYALNSMLRMANIIYTRTTYNIL